MLRDYQHTISTQGLDILKKYGLVYLCMEVRTGKTRTALHIAGGYGAKKVLFLTKKKAIASIYSDFKAISPCFDLYVTNYEQVHTIREKFDLVILDEAHCLGQYPVSAGKVKAVKKICDGLPVIYLSGTPTPESYSQIYHQFFCSSFTPFKQYKTFYEWAKDFVEIKKKYFYNREVNDYSQARKELIEQRTSHLFISLTQKEAGFTQMVQETILKVKMKEETYNLVKKLRKSRVYESKDGSLVLADTEVKLQQKLHQIFSGTVLTEDGVGKCFDYSKAEFIKKRFAGKKIAIFYKFRAEFIMLQWAFKGLITESPEEFNKRQDLVFASQIQSGREGINLSTADCLVMLNIDFSALSYFQARARLQTKDRTAAAQLYWIFSDGGIEEKIYEAVKNKEDYTLSYFRRDYLSIQNKAA
jgi:hypothetical protein